MTERALAQVPANGPVHAVHSSGVPPVTKMAAEDYNREGVVRAPPSDRSDPSRAMGPMEPIRAQVLRVPRLAPPRAVHTGVTTQNGHFPRNHPPVFALAGLEEEGVRPVRRHDRGLGGFIVDMAFISRVAHECT